MEPGTATVLGAIGLTPRGEAPSREDELAFLKEEAESAREYLEEVERRISELSVRRAAAGSFGA